MKERNHDRPDESSLDAFLHGELDDAGLAAFARSLEDDAELAERVGAELAFSEWIRQALRPGDEDAGEMFERAREAFSLSTEELIDRACDGELGSAEADRLAARLREKPGDAEALRRRLAEDEWVREALLAGKSENAFLEAMETRMWAETRRDHFVEDFTDRLDREIAEQDAESKVVAMKTSWTRQVAKMAAVAAVLAISAFLPARLLSEMVATPAGVASVVKASPDAAWGVAGAPDAEGELAPGHYVLEEGVVALRFGSGSELTVEGPAAFQVKEDEETFVYRGVALAKAATESEGMRIRSRGIRVSRPVPLIGIDARGANSTEAIVFSGDGGVCLDQGECRSLFEREAVKADLTSEKLFDVPYNPKPFSRAWAMASGVVENAGPVRIEPPGSRVVPGEGKGEVQVFVENDAFRPATDLEVDQVAPGRFASAEANPGDSLRAEGELRSYLLQVWPGEENSSDEVEASLTFDHPVVGLIFSSDRLAGSDHSVGTAMEADDADFNRTRGLDSGNDLLLLSDDRRTLNLKLRGGARQVDQVRVLVALTDSP